MTCIHSTKFAAVQTKLQFFSLTGNFLNVTHSFRDYCYMDNRDELLDVDVSFRKEASLSYLLALSGRKPFLQDDSDALSYG